MARKKGRSIHGILLLDKPYGWSSSELVQKIRHCYQAKKAGHTGALDPLATGVLPICLGEATKLTQYLLGADKTYLVTAKLGETTTTGDKEGEVLTHETVNVRASDIESSLVDFIGVQQQTPPMYSALKYEGRPLYHYARQGIEIPIPTRKIRIYNFSLQNFTLPYVSFLVRCSKGTYIRTLITDLGNKLGCGAYVSELRRTQISDFSSDSVLTIEEIEAKYEPSSYDALDAQLLPMDFIIQHLPKIQLTTEQACDFGHGRAFEYQQECHPTVRVYNDHKLLGIARLEQQQLQPTRVFNY